MNILKKTFLFILIFALLSCSNNEYKLYRGIGYSFGFKDDDYYPCIYENEELTETNELIKSFQCEISTIAYIKGNELSEFEKKVSEVKKVAINQSVCFDSQRLYVNKNKELIKNLAYLNYVLNDERFKTNYAEYDEYGYIKIEKETYELLKIAYEITILSQGYFNFCMGNLISKWDSFIKEQTDLPNNDEINEMLLQIPSYQKIKEIFYFNDSNHSILIDDEESNFTISLNAIAKGRFLDTINDIFVDQKALVDAGSSSISTYSDSIYDNWQIEIRNPNYLDDEKEHDKYLQLKKQGAFSLSVSGDYQNCCIFNNKRYHHIINPFTGFPSELHRSSVIIGNNATYADALSTVFMMLSNEECASLLTKINLEKNYSFNFITIDEQDDKIIYNVQKEIANVSLKSQNNVVISYI